MHPELPRVKVLGESLPSTYPVQYLSYPEDAPKIKHGLIIPANAESYSEFADMMKSSEKEYVSTINEDVRKNIIMA